MDKEIVALAVAELQALKEGEMAWRQLLAKLVLGAGDILVGARVGRPHAVAEERGPAAEIEPRTDDPGVAEEAQQAVLVVADQMVNFEARQWRLDQVRDNLTRGRSAI